jgi:hypothetical protein
MTINQLLKKKPPIDLIMEILNFININSLDTEKTFSIKTLESTNVLIKAKPLLKDLGEYYLPCKYKQYFENINNRKLITILKQCLKVYDYKIISIEKYSHGNKFIVYKIKSTKETPIVKKRPIIAQVPSEITLKFD